MIDAEGNKKYSPHDLKHYFDDLKDDLVKIKIELPKHFKEDKSAFESIKLSFGSVNTILASLERMLAKQNENSENHRKLMTEHMERVEPMLSAYEKDNAFSLALGEKGKKWGTYIISTAAVIGAWYVIKEFIVGFIVKIFMK